MDHVVAARAQMGTSLAFHIVFAALGVGLPALLLITEGVWLRTKDSAYERLLGTLTQATAILFAVGAVSGTILSFELGLLWPEFMRYAGGIIGLPFSAEGFAFFIEAIFIGLYVYGREKMSPLAHWLCAVPIAISGAVSAAFVICANAWMNLPAGFRLVRGRVTDVHPVAAMFGPAAPTEVAHGTLAAYVFTGFGVACVYAFAYLRGRREPHVLAGLRIAMVVGAVAIPLQLVVGDISARFDGYAEPAKLAAFEALYHTRARAPLTIGGIPDDAKQRVAYGIEVPLLLSLLTSENVDATVRGLDEFRAADRPPVAPVHFAFDLMVGSGSMLLAIAGWWFFTSRKRRSVPGRWLLRAISLSGIFALCALEAGWVVTEMGRQPWIARGLLRTTDAVTAAPGIDLAFYGFSLIYVALGATSWWLLLRLGKPQTARDRLRPAGVGA